MFDSVQTMPDRVARLAFVSGVARKRLIGPAFAVVKGYEYYPIGEAKCSIYEAI
jgi:hypothetical protein